MKYKLIIFYTINLLVFTLSSSIYSNKSFWDPRSAHLILHTQYKKHLWTELSPNIWKNNSNINSIPVVINRTIPSILVIHTQFNGNKNFKPVFSKNSILWSNIFYSLNFKKFYIKNKSFIPLSQRSQASGFIIHPLGIAITNQHVINKTSSIDVTIGNSPKRYGAYVIGEDKMSDIALIRIKCYRKNWPCLPFGNSLHLNNGDKIICVGNPLGLEISSSLGNIASCKRSGIKLSAKSSGCELIQLNAQLNPGNSGCPLINISGEVIGVANAISSMGQGIGFAIPVNQVKINFARLAGYINKDNEIGTKISSINNIFSKIIGLKFSYGALVNKIFLGTSADIYKLKKGDIIIRYNGMLVKNNLDLYLKMFHKRFMIPVEISILRNRKIFKLQFTWNYFSDNIEHKNSLMIDALGVSILKLYTKWDTRIKIVVDKIPNSNGFINNDTIIIVKDIKIVSCFQLKKLILNIKKGSLIRFMIARNGSRYFINILR